MGSAVNKRVMVVGAGIVGASLAYHLAGRGAQVILLEAEDIASGVTGRSFAWINTTHDGPDPIASLRGAAIHEYRRLETELPGLKVRWSGALSYGANPGEVPQASGNPTSATRVSRSQILDLEPNLKHPPQQAVYAAEEGALAAIVGRLASEEIIHGQDSPALAPCRPERFFQA